MYSMPAQPLMKTAALLPPAGGCWASPPWRKTSRAHNKRPTPALMPSIGQTAFAVVTSGGGRFRGTTNHGHRISGEIVRATLYRRQRIYLGRDHHGRQNPQ